MSTRPTDRGRIVLFALLACLGAGFFALYAANAAQPDGDPTADCAPGSLGDTGSAELTGGGNHDDEGDDDDEDGDVPGDDEICVCHVPPGNPEEAETICVGRGAVCAHLLHGDTLGPCPTTCGGELGSACGEGQFCDVPPGECDADGECADSPAVCPPIYAPVCGCDGRTYSSDCYAHVAGSAVSHEGICLQPQICGGTAGETCGEGQFCKHPVGECTEDAEGVCVDKPLNCPSTISPVCGCDGTTYDNACVAAASGVTVSHPGQCLDVQTCGGPEGGTCAEDQFCKRPPGDCAEDVQGICADKPLNCPAVIMPVCGCDGTTYDNACVAAAAGVTVDHQGECSAGAFACDGNTGVLCAAGFFCKHPVGLCSMSIEGQCTARPETCPVNSAPVCGCDGTTYLNDCLAAGAGVSVSSPGPCVVRLERSWRRGR